MSSVTVVPGWRAELEWLRRAWRLSNDRREVLGPCVVADAGTGSLTLITSAGWVSLHGAVEGESNTIANVKAETFAEALDFCHGMDLAWTVDVAGREGQVAIDPFGTVPGSRHGVYEIAGGTVLHYQPYTRCWLKTRKPLPAGVLLTAAATLQPIATPVCQKARRASDVVYVEGAMEGVTFGAHDSSRAHTVSVLTDRIEAEDVSTHVNSWFSRVLAQAPAQEEDPVEVFAYAMGEVVVKHPRWSLLVFGQDFTEASSSCSSAVSMRPPVAGSACAETDTGTLLGPALRADRIFRAERRNPQKPATWGPPHVEVRVTEGGRLTARTKWENSDTLGDSVGAVWQGFQVVDALLNVSPGKAYVRIGPSSGPGRIGRHPLSWVEVSREIGGVAVETRFAFRETWYI